jgi:GNAT superfamily N-acetyltransferase
MVVERRVSLESGEAAEITGLVVAASARRTGVGKALVSSAEQWTARQGLTAIRVRSNITRAESHPFYERLGFLRKKTQHTYEKPLGPSADR